MRFDLLSIFPEYFAALDLSLLGKAGRGGHLDIAAHNLRDWAAGKHRSVDDEPAGGGPGMVMRADVWGAAIDQILTEPAGPRRVLAIPTPAGRPLNQRVVEDLTGADQIIVACGRYEGLDARIAEHYRDRGVEVLEYSLGDYVLNGGEVAALALVEAVGRLVRGVVGNPDSLVEESHGADGLLEYPAYTQPRTWRDHPIPSVLLSGDHARIARWRRDRSLERTAQLRPDLIAQLSPNLLDGADRRALARQGWIVAPELLRVRFRPAEEADLAAVAELAARTFPDACPADVTRADQEAFIEQFLSLPALRGYMRDDEYRLFVAEIWPGAASSSALTPGSGQLVAYTLIARSIPEGMGRAPADSAYLSKCYTDQAFRGSGITGALVDHTLDYVRGAWAPPAVALATHYSNRRAARFYRNTGFRKAGRRIFDVGATENVDDVFVADLTD